MTRVIVSAVVVILFLGVVVVLWLRSRRSRQFGGVGFREYVRNPVFRSRVTSSFAHRNAIVEKLAKRPAKELVTMLLDGERYDAVKHAIKTAGPSVIPVLIDALYEPEFRQKTDPKEQDKIHLLRRRSAPLVTVLECLEAYAPEEAVPAIAPLVEDDDEEIRKHTALLLGTIGADSAVGPLTRSLSDDDDYVRSYATMGILRAIEAERISDGFRTGVFNAVQPLVFQRDTTVSGEAPKCLLGLDRDRAISFLTARESLTAGREGLQYVLRAVREAEVPVDEDLLLKLVSVLENEVDEYPNDYVLGEVLCLLARIDSESARAAIARGTESKSQRVREDATKALAASRGVHEPFTVAFNRLDSVGWSGLTEAQRRALAVRILIDEVDNGGFSQYFVNSSGDQWRDAVAGLEAIRATLDLVLFQNAIALFGPNGPSTNATKRHRELARIVKKDDEVFSLPEDKFYKDEQDREVLLLRYMISHSTDFSDEEL